MSGCVASSQLINGPWIREGRSGLLVLLVLRRPCDVVPRISGTAASRCGGSLWVVLSQSPTGTETDHNVTMATLQATSAPGSRVTRQCPTFDGTSRCLASLLENQQCFLLEGRMTRNHVTRRVWVFEGNDD